MEETEYSPTDFHNILNSPFPDICDSVSSEKTKYYVEVTQDRKRAYKCTTPDCGKIYRFKSEAERHAIMHRDDRPYCCSFKGCVKTFKRLKTLEDHVRTHEESLPFSCDKPGCDKKFASKPALRYHRLIHKNNRKFKCDIEGCEKSFLVQPQLKSHKKTYHPKPVLDLPLRKSFKIIKTEPKRRNVSDVMTKLSESIHWEMKTQKCKIASLEERMKENNDMILVILEENRILQEKLDKYEKVDPKVSSEKKTQINLEPANLVSPQKSLESNHPFDSYELKLLDFLKEQ